VFTHPRNEGSDRNQFDCLNCIETQLASLCLTRLKRTPHWLDRRHFCVYTRDRYLNNEARASLLTFAMDHQSFLAQLSPSERKQLQLKNNRIAVVHAICHFGLILVLGFLIQQRIPGWQILLLPQGVLLVFLFNLQHECTHKTPFHSSISNEIVGFFCAIILVQPFLWFRYFHLDHHRYTNDPEKDPELMGDEKPANWQDYVIFVTAVKYWRSKVTLLCSQCFLPIKDSYVPARAHFAITREARILITVYVALFILSVFVTPVFIWTWLIPLIIGFPFLKLYHLAEHGLCPLVDDKFQNTRTVLTNPLTRFITWNMPYHAEHHLLPSVKVCSKGYTQFTSEYLRNVKS